MKVAAYFIYINYALRRLEICGGSFWLIEEHETELSGMRQFLMNSFSLRNLAWERRLQRREWYLHLL